VCCDGWMFYVILSIIFLVLVVYSARLVVENSIISLRITGLSFGIFKILLYIFKV
jgi:hypothetical protein